MDILTLMLLDAETEPDNHDLECELARLDGVEDVTIDRAARWVTIAFDRGRVGAWDLVVAIEDQGSVVGGLIPAASRHPGDEPATRHAGDSANGLAALVSSTAATSRGWRR